MTTMEKTNIDDTIILLFYYYVKGALYISEVLDRTAHNFALDKDISREAKEAFKRDLGFTSRAIMDLGQAQKHYVAMRRHLSVVEQELDKRVHVASFDRAQASMYDLMSLDLAYCQIIDHGELEDKRQKFHNFLKRYNWDDALKLAYDNLQNRRALLSKGVTHVYDRKKGKVKKV